MVEHEYFILDIIVAWRIHSKSQKFYLPSSVFYMTDKPENINYDNYKSYLLCIEFVQNELDPC